MLHHRLRRPHVSRSGRVSGRYAGIRTLVARRKKRRDYLRMRQRKCIGHLLHSRRGPSPPGLWRLRSPGYKVFTDGELKATSRRCDRRRRVSGGLFRARSQALNLRVLHFAYPATPNVHRRDVTSDGNNIHRRYVIDTARRSLYARSYQTSSGSSCIAGATRMSSGVT